MFLVYEYVQYIIERLIIVFFVYYNLLIIFNNAVDLLANMRVLK